MDIHITTKTGQEIIWSTGEYTDYHYYGTAFVVLKNDRWIGIYNMDCIQSIVVGKEK